MARSKEGRKEYREGTIVRDRRGRMDVMGSGGKKAGVEDNGTTQRLERKNARLKKGNDLLEKVATVSGGTTSQRFGFIDEHAAEFGVGYLCRWLGVSRSGYYAWRNREISGRAREDRRLIRRIEAVFGQHRTRYGSPRIHRSLRCEGIHVGRKRVERLMRVTARCGRIYRRSAGTTRFFECHRNLRVGSDASTEADRLGVADLTDLRVGPVNDRPNGATHDRYNGAG